MTNILLGFSRSIVQHDALSSDRVLPHKLKRLVQLALQYRSSEIYDFVVSPEHNLRQLQVRAE